MSDEEIDEMILDTLRQWLDQENYALVERRMTTLIAYDQAMKDLGLVDPEAA